MLDHNTISPLRQYANPKVQGTQYIYIKVEKVFRLILVHSKCHLAYTFFGQRKGCTLSFYILLVIHYIKMLKVIGRVIDGKMKCKS